MKRVKLKPRHAKVLSDSYYYFKKDSGKKLILSGWRASGITAAVERCRKDGTDSRQLIDPFARLRL